MNTVQPTMGREKKFISLHEAINRIELAKGDLQQLLVEMENGPAPKRPEEITGKESPQFQKVYDSAPGRLIDAVSGIEEATRQLRERLF